MIGYLRRERRSHVLFHVLVWSIAAIALYLVLDRLSPVLYPVGLALFMAYFLNPVVTRLEKRGLPRALSILVLLALAVFLVWLAVILVIPLVAADLRHFSETVPATVRRLTESTIPWLEARFGVEIPHTFTEALERTGMDAGQLAAKLSTTVLPVLGFTFHSLPAVVHMLLMFIMVPVFAFYFLADFPHISKGVTELIPPRHREGTHALMAEVGTVVSSWVRGQLVVVSILAVLYAIGLWLCGIPLAIPVGILSGLLTFIPYVGTAIGFGLAFLMVLMDFSTGALGGVVLTFVGLHLLEAFVLTPVLVGKKVGLGEAGALVAILIGGELLGFVGILIAVPAAAAIMVIVRHATRVYRKSDFYTRGTDPVKPEGPLTAALADVEGTAPAPPPTQEG